LLTTHPEDFFIKKNESDIFAFASRLIQFGCVADIYGPYSRDLDHYDLILHFSLDGRGINFLEELWLHEKQIVLVPTFTADSLLNFEVINKILKKTSAIIYKSNFDKDMFEANFSISKNIKSHISKPFINSDILNQSIDGIFNDLYLIKNYAICFGSIRPNNNQLSIIHAAKKFGLSLVLIGKCDDKQYYQACKDFEPNNIFIESFPEKSKILYSALRDSLFCIDLSVDAYNSVLYEAGLLGCNLILRKSGWALEQFRSNVFYCESNNCDAISEAIQNALNSNNLMRENLSYEMSKYCSNINLENLLIFLKKLKNECFIC
jgi:glycosyltransferase involved in cell wall biosynthesis